MSDYVTCDALALQRLKRPPPTVGPDIAWHEKADESRGVQETCAVRDFHIHIPLIPSFIIVMNSW